VELVSAMRGRRTCKTFTGDPVARDVVAELVDLACQAPNHRLTQPWRFAAIDQLGISRLVAFLQQPQVAGAVDSRKLPAICERLARCGAVVQLTCVVAGEREQQREDRDACCAALQNFLLGAHGAGLGTFWSTSPLLAHPEVLRWFGADPAVECHVGTVWLGVPAEQPVAPKRRPLAEVLHWL
jgi:nitroreductase